MPQIDLEDAISAVLGATVSGLPEPTCEERRHLSTYGAEERGYQRGQGQLRKAIVRALREAAS